MEHVDKLIERIAEATSQLAPLSQLSAGMPLAPVQPLQSLIQHLQSTNVHDVYFPFVRFAALHAARVATAWVAMTHTRGGNPGVLQDLFGFLTVSWGGGTVAAMLTSTPPAWLISPTPWLIYPAVYALLIPTGMALFIVQTAPALPFNLAMSVVDGLARGVAITAVPTLVASSSVAAGGWWATAILGAVATNGGGWVVQLLGLSHAQWTIGRPNILGGGILGTLDVWGAMLCSIVYCALTRTYSELAPVTDFLAQHIPDELRDAKAAGPVSNDTARAIAVLLLTCLFAARVITTQVLAWRNGPRRVQTKVEPPVNKNSNAAAAVVVKTPVEKSGLESATSSPKPRKRKTKSKSKSPAPQ